MNNKIAFAVVGGVLSLTLVACGVTIRGVTETVRGSGTLVEEDRPVGNLSRVELTMPGTLSIAAGDTESLRVEAEDNLLEYIQTDVRAGTLRIETRPGINLRATRPIRYALTVVKLDSIAVTSSGDVEAADLQSKSFSVKISSSGNVTLFSLDATSLDVTISSSGNLEIRGGQVERQTIHISSSGEYRAQDLPSADAEVILTSSGSATVRVSDRLTGRLSSSGDVRYVGNPSVDVRTTSSGKAVHISD
jgi:hypothetical protein